MVQRFVRTGAKGRTAIERQPELMYVCKADANHSRLPRAMHRHDDRIEIVFIIEGSGSHIIGGQPYDTHKGDVLIYNSGVLHDESANPTVGMSTYCCAFKNLKLKGLPGNFITPPQGQVVFPSGEFYPELKSLLDMLYAHAGMDYRSSLTFCDQLLQALVTLVYHLVNQDPSEVTTKGSNLGERTKRYIDEHYLESIDLKTLSEKLRVSPYYLSHQFKRAIGCTPIQYLIRRRIGEAQSLLVDTSLTVTDIATMVGYDNSNYFNTVFKKVVGVTPNTYRKQCAGTLPTQLV